jgi:hypothetical protein
VTLGSGKNLLDGFVRATFNARSQLLADEVRRIHAAVLPAHWCLQMMERAQGHEMAVLNNAGVGGYFHFSYQTRDEEGRQPPALYVLCDPVPERQMIATWAFRIAFCEAALVVECPVRQERTIILDPAAWPRALELSANEIEEMKLRIQTQTVLDPYYNICGFGTVNPAYRRHNPMVATNEGRYMIDRSGKQAPEFMVMVRGVFGDDAAAYSSMRELQMRVAPEGGRKSTHP